MNNQEGEWASPQKRDLLVIITGSRADESFERISAAYKVQQVVSHRVLVVEGNSGELAELKQIPGVSVIASGDAAPGVTEKLDEGESLFVTAWISRMKEGPKNRSGDGLNWDAPGFEPPDPPAEGSERNK